MFLQCEEFDESLPAGESAKEESLEVEEHDVDCIVGVGKYEETGV